jgi:hypothetical protein
MEEQQLRVSAEAAAAVASAAAEVASDKLANKEQQLLGWKELEQSRKEVSSQQLQMSQVSRHGRLS